jgi:hypothetical protein
MAESQFYIPQSTRPLVIFFETTNLKIILKAEKSGHKLSKKIN